MFFPRFLNYFRSMHDEEREKRGISSENEKEELYIDHFNLCITFFNDFDFDFLYC